MRGLLTPPWRYRSTTGYWPGGRLVSRDGSVEKAMRFGIFTFSRAPYAEIARHFRVAEELGFASAWVNDDLMVPDYADFEPWTLLGTLARDTTRIRLGTMVRSEEHTSELQSRQYLVCR